MLQASRLRRNMGGSVLICALAFVVIIALLLAGISTLVVSHYSRASLRGDYSSALNLADAGINYEIYLISQDVTNRNVAHQAHATAGQLGPYTSTISNVTGSFTVSVSNDPDDGKPWYAPNPMIVTSTGLVNGATRTVSARGARHGIFQDYSFFSIDGANMGGSLIANGDLGTNVAFSFTNSSGNVYGTVTFDGAPSGFWPPGHVTGGVFHNPDKVVWPTVSTIADSAVSQKTGSQVSVGSGLSWLSANNDNSQIQVLSPSDKTGVDPASFKYQNAGLNSSSWLLDNTAFKNASSDTNIMDQPPTGTFPIPSTSYVGKRFVFPDTSFTYTNPNNTVNVSGYGLYNTTVLILPGSGNSAVTRDYYFENINLSGSQSLLIDNANGPIRIWLGAVGGSKGSSQQDNLSGTIYCTSSDPSKLRIYDAKSATLNISNNAVFSGCIYDYNGVGVGDIKLAGNPVLNGSIIGSNFTLQGNPTINYQFPKDNSSDYGIWYGYKDMWGEKNAM